MDNEFWFDEQQNEWVFEPHKAGRYFYGETQADAWQAYTEAIDIARRHAESEPNCYDGIYRNSPCETCAWLKRIRGEVFAEAVVAAGNERFANGL